MVTKKCQFCFEIAEGHPVRRDPTVRPIRLDPRALPGKRRRPLVAHLCADHRASFGR